MADRAPLLCSSHIFNQMKYFVFEDRLTMSEKSVSSVWGWKGFIKETEQTALQLHNRNLQPSGHNMYCQNYHYGLWTLPAHYIDDLQTIIVNSSAIFLPC
jgi:hypothetical protein